MLKRIFSYMKQYKKYAFLALFCIAVEAVLELMVPMIMADLIDTGVATGDERYIYQKGFQMVLCAAAALVLGIGSARFLQNMQNRREQITFFVEIMWKVLHKSRQMWIIIMSA